MIGPGSAERILILATVAREHSMTAAAATAGYSVSAISQQVRKLEQEVGAPLLQRHSRGILLTDAGRAIVEHAERIQGQLTSLQRSLDDIAGLRAGSLRMGTFPTAGSSLLPAAINRFRRQFPNVELTVRSLRKAPLLTMLASREISMSLLWEYPWSRIDYPNLELIHLMDDPTDLVVSHTHPMADRETVSVSELVDEMWVIRAEKHPVVEAIVRASNRVGFEPKVAFEANDYQEAQAMVAVGIGVALVPRLALSVQRSDVKVIPLTGIVPRRRILLARVVDAGTGPAELAMVRMLLEAAQEMSSPSSPVFRG